MKASKLIKVLQELTKEHGDKVVKYLDAEYGNRDIIKVKIEDEKDNKVFILDECDY